MMDYFKNESGGGKLKGETEDALEQIRRLL